MATSRKVIGFDLDGTLLDSMTMTISLIKGIIAKSLLVPEMPPDLQKYFNLSEEKLFYSAFGPEKGELLLREYYSQFFARIDEATPFIGVRSLLEKLKSNQFRMAVYTARGRESTVQMLKAHQLEKYFEFILTGSDVENPKPHPEGIQKMLNHFGIQKENFIYVGDSYRDIEMAKVSGVRSIAVTWCSFSDKNKMFACQPDVHFSDPSAVEHYLNDENQKHIS